MRLKHICKACPVELILVSSTRDLNHVSLVSSQVVIPVMSTHSQSVSLLAPPPIVECRTLCHNRNVFTVRSLYCITILMYLILYCSVVILCVLYNVFVLCQHCNFPWISIMELFAFRDVWLWKRVLSKV